MIGWKLPGEERERLLQRFVPKYDTVVADHVTLRSGTNATTPLPSPVQAQVVGRADDRAGVECLVVELDGSTDRPDGSTYHITWSLGRDARRAKATTCSASGAGNRSASRCRSR